jgi:ubiquinone/menaquinone biosynthesis C-methylase UbiE
MKLEIDLAIEFILCDAECLPLKNECFDVVLCNCALEHIKNDEKAIEETYRVLVKNGIFILTVPSEKRRIILPLISFWIHTPKTLRKILAPKYLWEDAKTPEEAIWRLKKGAF